MFRILTLSLLVLFSAACQPAPAVDPVTQTLPPPQVFTMTPRPSLTPFPAATRRPEQSPTPTPTQQPDLYAPYSITALRARTYEPGTLEIERTDQLFGFKRHMLWYTSDGLRIHGYINIPDGEGPYPIIILLHGFSYPADYDTLGYLTDMGNSLAQNDFAVAFPDLRGYGPSDSGDTLFQVGYAIDVLNLIATIKAQAGQPGLLENIDPTRIGLLGHSMGGGIALRVLTISSDIKAALLYAATSGDQAKNSQIFFNITGDPSYQDELNLPIHILLGVSPASFYRNITASVHLYHGTADAVVPLAWADETCQLLKVSVTDVECTFFDGGEHTFRSRYNFGPQMKAFFIAKLKQ
jgi:dipeptidyl aminopeptidase/acylaminoacyl peptidase